MQEIIKRFLKDFKLFPNEIIEEIMKYYYEDVKYKKYYIVHIWVNVPNETIGNLGFLTLRKDDINQYIAEIEKKYGKNIDLKVVYEMKEKNPFTGHKYNFIEKKWHKESMDDEFAMYKETTLGWFKCILLDFFHSMAFIVGTAKEERHNMIINFKNLFELYEIRELFYGRDIIFDLSDYYREIFNSLDDFKRQFIEILKGLYFIVYHQDGIDSIHQTEISAQNKIFELKWYDYYNGKEVNYYIDAKYLENVKKKYGKYLDTNVLWKDLDGFEEWMVEY